ncbi:multi-sensor domain-containing diguanylate cyclase [Aliarcobacter faecis]|uniref:sensor domain-containing diguanylate cyclase n=1 Tax=Aliarcobacter faecis TaxID=1564138 RepID=UPI00047E1FE7|nr:diguanylate cyclase [Aliarcobacter faecis]QKF72925.1 multi-sensor domain-containing diguanylate cyclase [Aliarcobacter faecis]
MFKSKLFLKILSIFILPVLAILIYSSYILYEKNETLKQAIIYKKTANLVKASKDVFFALEKEKHTVLDYLKQRNKDKLEVAFSETSLAYNEVLKLLKELKLELKFESKDINLNLITYIRDRVDKNDLTTELVIENYDRTKEIFLSSIFSPKQFIYLNSSRLNMDKIIKFLGEDSNLNYTKDFLTRVVELFEADSNIQVEKVYSDRLFSFIFLIISVITLFSILYVLKNIVHKEEESFVKIKNYKDIYKILSQVNKFLIRIYDKKDFYINICEILAQNENLKFVFFYDAIEKNITAKNSEFKDTIVSQVDKYKDLSHENLVSKTIKWQSNIIINNFERKNLSIFYDEARKLDIKSMATFPIREFDNVVGALIIYSKQKNFFDKEIEGLFEKLVGDISHCLEKIKFEEQRVAQDDELRLSSYSFDVAEPMLITDIKGNIVRVNQAFCSIMGYTKDELMGINPRIFKTPHQDHKFIEDMWNNLRINGFWSGELYNKKANDEIIPLKGTITAIKDKNGKTTHYLGQYFDIGKIKDKEKVLEYQATHDNLTGLPNRLLLTDRIEQAIRKVTRHKIIGGLIFIDLDNFKVINDTLGHDIGDVLLINVAKKMKESIREEDTVSRVGGDEFVILLDNLGSTKDEARRNIKYLATKIKNALNSIEYIEGHINISTPSIGITLFNDDSVSVKDLIKQADTAMYEAKKQGKNSIELFED